MPVTRSMARAPPKARINTNLQKSSKSAAKSVPVRQIHEPTTATKPPTKRLKKDPNREQFWDSDDDEPRSSSQATAKAHKNINVKKDSGFSSAAAPSEAPSEAGLDPQFLKDLAIFSNTTGESNLLKDVQMAKHPIIQSLRSFNQRIAERIQEAQENCATSKDFKTALAKTPMAQKIKSIRRVQFREQNQEEEIEESTADEKEEDHEDNDVEKKSKGISDTPKRVLTRSQARKLGRPVSAKKPTPKKPKKKGKKGAKPRNLNAAESTTGSELSQTSQESHEAPAESSQSFGSANQNSQESLFDDLEEASDNVFHEAHSKQPVEEGTFIVEKPSDELQEDEIIFESPAVPDTSVKSIQARPIVNETFIKPTVDKQIKPQMAKASKSDDSPEERTVIPETPPPPPSHPRRLTVDQGPRKVQDATFIVNKEVPEAIKTCPPPPPPQKTVAVKDAIPEYIKEKTQESKDEEVMPVGAGAVVQPRIKSFQKNNATFLVDKTPTNEGGSALNKNVHDMDQMDSLLSEEDDSPISVEKLVNQTYVKKLAEDNKPPTRMFSPTANSPLKLNQLPSIRERDESNKTSSSKNSQESLGSPLSPVLSDKGGKAPKQPYYNIKLGTIVELGKSQPSRHVEPPKVIVAPKTAPHAAPVPSLNTEEERLKRMREKEEQATRKKEEYMKNRTEALKKKNEEWEKKANKATEQKTAQAPPPPSAEKSNKVIHNSNYAQKYGSTTTYAPFHPIKATSSVIGGLKKAISAKDILPAKFQLPKHKPNPNESTASSSSQSSQKLNLTPKTVLNKPMGVFKEPTNPFTPPRTPLQGQGEGGGDESFHSAVMETTYEVNNYDITTYEEFDDDMKHRKEKKIPGWADSSNRDQINKAVLFQLPVFLPRVTTKIFPKGVKNRRIFSRGLHKH